MYISITSHGKGLELCAISQLCNYTTSETTQKKTYKLLGAFSAGHNVNKKCI
jgi:hypothetical protein